MAPLTVTRRTSPGATTAVPVIVGVVSRVNCGFTVGTDGGTVSIASSLVVVSLAVLPAASVTVAVTA